MYFEQAVFDLRLVLTLCSRHISQILPAQIIDMRLKPCDPALHLLYSMHATMGVCLVVMQTFDRPLHDMVYGV